MLRQTPNRRHRWLAPANSDLESSYESRPGYHPVEVHTQAGPTQVSLHNQAVEALVTLELLRSWVHMTISLSHRFFTISLLALTVALSGCASRLERPRLPDVFIDPAPGGKTNGTYTLAAFKCDFGAYTDATNPPLPPREPAAATARNKMVYGVLAEIDYVYHNYEMSLFMNEGSFKVATDVLQLGLGMASTITNGERSKTVLSAVLTGVTGTSLSIDKNFFRQQTVQSLISSMQAGRDQTKAIIIRHLIEPATSYPFQAPRSDLAAYFFAGTLPGALQQLNQTAAAKANDQRIALK